MNRNKQFCVFCFFLINLFCINLSRAAVHDPTKPIISPMVYESAINEADYNLQSILIGPMRRLAMINGKLVGTGSKIQGARVLAIDKNHVVMFYAGHRKVLYLFGRRLWKAR